VVFFPGRAVLSVLGTLSLHSENLQCGGPIEMTCRRGNWEPQAACSSNKKAADFSAARITARIVFTL